MFNNQLGRKGVSMFETPNALKLDFIVIKSHIICLFKGHSFEPDEFGWFCNRCFWDVVTEVSFESWEEAVENSPNSRYWRKSL